MPKILRTRSSSARLLAPLSLAIALFSGAIVASAGCAKSTEPSGFTPGDDASDDASFGPDGDPTGGGQTDAPVFVGDVSAPVGTLVIQPANPVINVTITNGNAAVAPVTFTALNNGTTQVAATWTLDRGELGNMIAASGLFTPSGSVAGVGKIIASYGGTIASTTVTILIKSTQNGGPLGAPNGGVGGEGLGGPVDSTTTTTLQGPGTAPTSPQQLSWLYPYDKTIWPRGILPPLLQWQTSLSATAVSIHLTEKYFDFQGFYSSPTALTHQPIDQTAWKQALYSNTGDPLHVEVKLFQGGAVTGPITEDWTVAPGILRGTVYYDSYSSRLVGSSNGAVLAIKPGAAAPVIAVPGSETKCLVCHEISGNGSTLIAQHDGNNNKDGTAYDLTANGTAIASYYNNAPDGTSNAEKFVWSALYPDGTFAMANSRFTREAYQDDSHLFARANGNEVAATGWDGVVATAVTPTFSTDGKQLAFNFWEGVATNGVQPGNGRSLAVMDFACGSPDGGAGCANPPYTFSNAREVYRDTTNSRYVGWPAFLPDGKSLVFHNTLKYPTNWNSCPAAPTAGTAYNCELSTWNGAQAELWFTDVPAAPGPTQPIPLDGLNGKGYLPTNTLHPTDAVLNYEPTVNPIASGGYYWIVFTSRRMYGNVAAGDPYDNGDGTIAIPKKLWVAAIDIHPTPGKDPSHPAFYLPGQELQAGNMRGHWVVDPCKANGTSCETGDECCNGFCRQPGDGGALQCTDKPQGCAQEFENCTTDADCCGTPTYTCINNRCARVPVN